jgi:peptide/nickel transport system substrate-binding protein
MDATSAFDNESIWLFEQLMEPLYTVTADGKGVKPWLATSYDLSKDKKAYTVHLRKGGQAHVNEFPGWAQVKQLQHTAGITMTLFPSTRTDYVLFNEHFKPFQDVHVRRALSYLIDRKALVKAILFGNGTVANSFMPPNLAYYDPKSPGIQYNLAKAKQELAKSSVPKGFTATFEAQAGVLDSQTIGQVMQAAAKPLGITINIVNKDTNAVAAEWNAGKYPGMINQYWTMDIADPDELVSFSIDPAQSSHSFQTFYNNPAAAAATVAATREFDPKKRQALYSKVQRLASQDAFMAFLYYSPYRYAYSSKVHGFFVYPTANYHMEDVWLQK